MLAPAAGLRVARHLPLVAMQKSGVFTQCRQSSPVRRLKRQTIQIYRRGHSHAPRNNVRQRLLELAADYLSHAQSAQHLFINGRVKTIATDTSPRIQFPHGLYLRNGRSRCGMHRKMKGNPVRSPYGLKRHRFAGKIHCRHLVTFIAKPGSRRSEPEWLSAEVVG